MAMRTASCNSSSPRGDGPTRRHASKIAGVNTHAFMLTSACAPNARAVAVVGLLDDAGQ